MLLAAARHEARMAKPADPKEVSGPTVRAHIEAAVRMGRLPASALEGPEIPEPLQYLWDWYWELARGRTANPLTGAPNPISYQDIEAWSRLLHRHPTPDDVRTLLAIDAEIRHPSEERD